MKGLEELIAAFRDIVSNSDTIIDLVIVSSNDNTIYKEKLIGMIRALKVEKNVRFVGSVENSMLPVWLNASDLLVLPSHHEGFGRVLIEAMACGKPVIATKCGGPEDIILNKFVGVLVPPKNAQALAKAIICVLDNPQQYLAQEIRAYCLSKFQIDNVLEKYETLFQSVIKNANNR